MDISTRIKVLRKHLGLTQREFADKLHISSSLISSYENGTRCPTHRTISNIIQIFEVNPSWIHNGILPIFSEYNYSKIHRVSSKIQALSDDDRAFIERIIDCLLEKQL